MLGEYWCQAVVTNSSGQYLVIESNVLMVLRPEDYMLDLVCVVVCSLYICKNVLLLHL